MLCEQCLAFWRAVETEVSSPDSQRIRHGSPAGSLQIRWPRYSAILHDSLAQLERAAKKRCHICFCIFHCCRAYNSQGVPIEGLELETGLNPEVVLKLEGSDSRSATLSAAYRCRIGTDRAGEVVATVTIGVFDGLFADEDTGATLKRCVELDSNGTGSAAAFELASFWLRRCLSTHEKCLNAHPLANFMPTRVIDVGNGRVRLVQTAQEKIPDTERRYFALSHCWGTTQIITTTNGNLKRHLEGISFQALSRTFQDAVTTTRRLSFRYLWIDSLCIIQDSKSDWEREAVQMCDIYRNATLTLGAAHASGGEEGCFFNVTEGMRYLPLVVELDVRTPDHEHIRCRPVFEGRGRGMKSNEMSLSAEPALHGRVWVLQEQLLSLRSLSFDGPKLRWNCLETDGSMMVILDDYFMEPLFYAKVRNLLADGKDFFTNRQDYSQWYELVQEYTHRGMTIPSDRLFALAGIAVAIAETTKAQYCAGLWVEDLFQGLLWHVPHVDMAPTAFTQKAFDLNRNKRVRHEKLLAPTWSWASVTVPITYPGLLDPFPMSCIRMNAACSTSPFQSDIITITGQTRTAYVNSVYPKSIPDAHDSVPDMVLWDRVGKGRTYFTFREYVTFQPSNLFLFSETPAVHETEWQFVHGEWCPDEVLDPSTCIIFLAIAQQYIPWDEAVAVYTIGLIPTGDSSNEFRRVGYAKWDSCAWYGYSCGDGTEAHRHDFVMEGPPDMSAYHDSVHVRTGTFNIV